VPLPTIILLALFWHCVRRPYGHSTARPFSSGRAGNTCRMVKNATRRKHSILLL